MKTIKTTWMTMMINLYAQYQVNHNYFMIKMGNDPSYWAVGNAPFCVKQKLNLYTHEKCCYGLIINMFGMKMFLLYDMQSQSNLGVMHSTLPLGIF